MTRDEAIKLVKRIKGAMVYTEEEKEAIETLIPELRESEDERIRKDIVIHFELIKEQALYDRQEESNSIVSSCNEKINWLEKQKEQKQWSEEDERKN